jgi:hypothetical protein
MKGKRIFMHIIHRINKKKKEAKKKKTTTAIDSLKKAY